MKNQTIGVEVEFTGLTRSEAAQIIADYFGTSYRITSRSPYYKHEIRDNEGRIWTVMRDCSVNEFRKLGRNNVIPAPYTRNEEYKCELVTPILRYKDIETLQEIIRLIRKGGMYTDNSCGIHVHIGAKDMSAKQICNLVKTVNAHDDLIYKALNIAEYREEKYCHKTNQRFLKDIETHKPTTIAELEHLWYNGSSRAHVHYDLSRYQGLNLHSLFSKGTVEFRLFDSVTHAGKIKAYIHFCLAIVAKARTDKRCSSKPIVTDNPKYTFRCWLLKLGLNGDEFKTCRLHMMAKLEGNGSYRHGA